MSHVDNRIGWTSVGSLEYQRRALIFGERRSEPIHANFGAATSYPSLADATKAVEAGFAQQLEAARGAKYQAVSPESSVRFNSEAAGIFQARDGSALVAPLAEGTGFGLAIGDDSTVQYDRLGSLSLDPGAHVPGSRAADWRDVVNVTATDPTLAAIIGSSHRVDFPDPGNREDPVTSRTYEAQIQ